MKKRGKNIRLKVQQEDVEKKAKISRVFQNINQEFEKGFISWQRLTRLVLMSQLVSETFCKKSGRKYQQRVMGICEIGGNVTLLFKKLNNLLWFIENCSYFLDPLLQIFLRMGEPPTRDFDLWAGVNLVHISAHFIGNFLTPKLLV